MYKAYFSKLKTYLISLGIESEKSMLGLQEADIAALEEQSWLSFPQAYRSWLGVAGKALSGKIWDHAHTSPMGAKDLMASQREIRKYAPLLDDRSINKLFISYYPAGEAFTYLELNGENPPVWLFWGSNSLDDTAYTFLASSFVGYVREAIIRYIKQRPKQYAHLGWVSLDTWEDNQRTIGYKERRFSFQVQIEAEEKATGRLLLPDEFQRRWVALNH